MEFPSLPTDNLYKFYALAGLIGLVLAFWHFDEKADHMRDESIRFENEAATLQLEQKFLLEEQTALLKRLDELKKQDFGRLTADEAEKHRAELAHFQTELEKQAKAQRLKVQELVNKQRSLADVVGRTHDSWVRMRFTLCSLLIWSLYGFIVWHRKIQVFQDRILRNEAEKIAPSRRKAN